MRKPALYSRSPSGPSAPTPTGEAATPGPGVEAKEPPARRRKALARAAASPRVLWACMALLGLALAASTWSLHHRGERATTQKDIDAAVRHSLSTQSLPSAAARAAARIAPAVVLVRSFNQDKQGEEQENGVGTGVVIVDKGVILTNLHVVQSAQTIRLVFADGSESKASVLSVQPDQDLAVLQAHTVPDDLQAATLRSTTGLVPGDGVVAVGFPFGIGPSASAGIVSGLGRNFKSPEGKQELGNLIQFDAAANPGNSGGPLVSMEGEMIGVVTGILNPTSHRTFVGIGFAVPIESAAAGAGLPPF